jgi:hypothetical protein
MVIPYSIMVAFGLVTKEDDEVALNTTLIPSFLIVHLVFGLLFIKRGFTTKLFTNIILSLVSFGLFMIQLRLRLFTTRLDSFGLFDLVLYNFLAGLIVWETYFYINKKYDLRNNN